MSARPRAAGTWAASLGLAALLATLVPGCGGGGPTAPPPPPRSNVRFTADGTPGEATIHLTQQAVTAATLLRLEVRASMVEDLVGLGFDLSYPDGLLDFASGSALAGGFLSSDGARVELLVDESPGNLIIGLSRLGAADGLGGSGLLLTLDFTATASGSGNFRFRENAAFDSRGRSLGAEWQAGSVEVTL